VVVTVLVSAELSKILDKEYEEKSLAELVDAPVSALAGVSDADAKLLLEAFNIKTVGDLARNKHFHTALAISQLADSVK
jgi:hypothetical protein